MVKVEGYEVPEGLYYSKDFAWIKVEGDNGERQEDQHTHRFRNTVDSVVLHALEYFAAFPYGVNYN